MPATVSESVVPALVRIQFHKPFESRRFLPPTIYFSFACGSSACALARGDRATAILQANITATAGVQIRLTHLLRVMRFISVPTAASPAPPLRAQWPLAATEPPS